MSTAFELLRLASIDDVRDAFRAAVEYELTRDEARQVAQIQERTSEAISECVRRVVASRPKIERSELIIGSLLTASSRALVDRMGSPETIRRLKLLLARQYPDVVARALRIHAERFSLLLAEADAVRLREHLGPRSIEATITQLVDTIGTE